MGLRRLCAPIIPLLALVVFALCGGCGLELPGSRPSLAQTILRSDDALTVHEEQDHRYFESAQLLDARVGTDVVVRGSLSSSEVDVYDVGPVDAGDRVYAEMIPDDGLRGAMGLFDGDGAALLINDHRNTYLGRTEPYADVVVRRSADHCYIALSVTPGYESAGGYSLVVRRTPDAPLPAPRPDQVLLVFSGGAGVRIGSRSAVEVPEFYASSIDPRFAGTTEELIAEVVQRVREDFIGYDVEIRSTSEGAIDDGEVTKVYFGTFDAALLGVAEGVDEFNATRAQSAIIFTDTFQAFARLDPSVSELAQALANVASHEIGHLLGLVHTRDPVGVMDVSASLSQLLLDQQFKRSPLDDLVFPLGSQDAAQLLLDTTGGDAELVRARQKAVNERVILSPRAVSGPSAYDACYLSTCALEH
jgi:hypothetical protein